jgi:hypothetical protein
MTWCGCGVFFELKNTILFNEFDGVCGRLYRDMVAI